MQRLLLSLLLLCALCAGAQNIKYVIKPGESIAGIKLGMSPEMVVRLIGEPETINTLEEYMAVMKASEGDNYAIDSNLVFVLGFDKIYRYPTESKVHPIFQAAFRDNKLVYLKLSSYITEKENMEQYALSNGIRFYDHQRKVRKALGADVLEVTYRDYSGEELYYTKGIEATFDNYELTVVSIFKPDRNLKARIAARSAFLRKLYRSIKGTDETQYHSL